MKITGEYTIDDNNIVVFPTVPSTDDTVYDIEKNFIKELKVMGFLEFVRLSHILKITKPVAPVLDIGCGYGHYGYSLYTNRYGVDYVGININYKQLLRAVSRKWGNSRRTFIYKDATKGLPFEDRSFETILLVQVIEHLGYENARALLEECYRVLNDGTLVITTENNQFTTHGGLEFHEHEFKYDELKDLILSCGFDIQNEYGLLYAYNIKTIEDGPEKSFLQSRQLKMIYGISRPKKSKYIVFDLKRR